MGNFKDLTGQRFGKLLVLGIGDSYVRPNGKKELRWLCKCDCGGQTLAATYSLRNGNTKGCGCRRLEVSKIASITHGMRRTSVYRIWSLMKNRCDNPNDKRYKDYGGRGISYCEKWKTFEGFFEDMGISYFKGGSIERMNVNGNYEKSNCTWVTMQEQAKNTRRTIRVTYLGETMTLLDLCERSNLPYTIIRQRLNKYKMSIEDAIQKPIRKSRTGKSYNLQN